MSVRKKAKHILVELRGHVPFTLFGTAGGLLLILVFRGLGEASGRVLFEVFHPAHVLLSAMVTASMFKMHAVKNRFLVVLVVGYVGSIGIATLSDIILPHIGTKLLGLDVPTHAQVYHESELEHQEHEQEPGDEHGIHLGFIEQWYSVNPAALLGIILAYFLPHTKFPHSGHVLISTWASSSYILMGTQSALTAGVWISIFSILFLAVWVPCCISDIIFPLLFVKPNLEISHHIH